MLIKRTLAVIIFALLVLTVNANSQEYKIIEARVWDDGSLRLKLEDTATTGSFLSNVSCFTGGNASDQNVSLKDFVFTDLNDGAMTDRALSIALAAQMAGVNVNAEVHNSCSEKWGTQRSQLTYIQLAL